MNDGNGKEVKIMVMVNFGIMGGIIMLLGLLY